MNIKKHLVVAMSLIMLSYSCSNDDDNYQQEPKGAYDSGILVTNEGNFNGGIGTVSYISNDFLTVENNVFSNVNGRPLGTVAQSMAFNGDLAYIVINVSNQIEVVNRYTFKSVATINSGLKNPRYITFISGKGYVTNWGEGSNPSDDYVAVINLETNTVSSTIAVEEGPERIISNGTTIYVAHEGGFSQNNIVSVINPTSNVVTTIPVGDVPNSMVFDKQGKLYVLSGGIPSYKENETAGKLSVINTTTNTVTSTLNFKEGEHPSSLAFEESLYYYMNKEVYKFAIGDLTLPEKSEFESVNFKYMTAHNDVLYLLEDDYVSNGTLKSFDLKTNTETHSTTVGLIPGGVYFND